MKTRNLSLGDRDQSSRELNQSLRREDMTDRQLLDSIDESKRRGDMHSLNLLLEECGNRCDD